MHKKKGKIGLVCYANYCRSPVAETILKNINTEYQFVSAGVSPHQKRSMHPFSEKFLRTNGYAIENSFPKKVNLDFLFSCDAIYAMDPIVFMQLIEKHKIYSKKIFLFNKDHRSLEIYDPFKFGEEDYFKCMKNIEYICKNLKVN